ncbi:hypothetical protein [Streptomyces avicenniae]|uniref:hypothetical protein n=1 Tax=Streptomyces avicenniae TaxID=500153 RepID=UPI00069B05FA|nr:hypothetical protein [Streptomyces avicenniae]
MNTLAAPRWPPGVSARALAAAAGALVVAFVVAPGVLAAVGPGGGLAGGRGIGEAVREAFVGYWGTDGREFTPELEGVVAYWFRYHVAKAVIAGMLLAVLVALAVPVGRAFLRADGLGAGRRAALAGAGALVAGLGALALVTVMANIQGALAPYSSLLPMLTEGTSDAELTGTLDQVTEQLRDAAGAAGPGHEPSPAVDAMIGDFAHYHAVMAVIAAVAAVVLVGLSVWLWRRFAGTPAPDRRKRRVLGSVGTLAVFLSLAVLVVAVANTSTAADPAPALLAFFDGGW